MPIVLALIGAVALFFVYQHFRTRSAPLLKAVQGQAAARVIRASQRRR